MRNIISKNPYTGQIKEQIPFVTNELLLKYFDKAKEGFEINRKRGAKEKSLMIKSLRPVIERKKTQIAKLITFQTGKPITQSQNEVADAIKYCDYYGKHSEAILPQNVKTDAKKKTLIKYLPMGTVFNILPFTDPFLLNFKTVLPQLLLGNCALVRNSDSTPGVAKIVESLMHKVGFQSGEYQNIFSNIDQSQQILAHPHIVGLNFIGSNQNGSVVAALAGKYLKKTNLFLGSNDALIVMEDANIALSVQNVLKVGSFNSGQGGAHPKRIIVKKQIYQTFKEQLITKLSKINVGNPQLRDTQIGPLARLDLINKLNEQLKRLPKGYKQIFKREDVNKPFYPPTIIQGTSQPFNQELLGPIFLLFKAQNDQQVIELANSTQYGLATYIFSDKLANPLIDSFNSGVVYLNGTSFENSSIPYGGVGKSGYGRLGWYEGVRQFANIKTNYIN